MKKVTLFVFVGLIAIHLSAQKINTSEVPELVKTAFEKSYPGTKTAWEKENGNFEASFKKEGKEMSVVIDNKGAILETETSMAVTEPPPPALAYLKSHYNEMIIKELPKL